VDDLLSDIPFLAESSLFEGVAGSAISGLSAVAQVREYAAGETIVQEGDHGDAVFLLYEGTVAVRARGRGGEDTDLATLHERGEFFGEAGLIDPGPRSATVAAVTEAVLLELSVNGLARFFGDFPSAEVTVMRNIARMLARRLRDSNLLLGAS